MRVLIVEDNVFNAYCLRRLLESMMTFIAVTIVNNSQAALSHVNTHFPELLIIDGDLNAAGSEIYCNGPELTAAVLSRYPNLPVIAWTDSEAMRHEFETIFKLYSKTVNHFSVWNKLVSAEHILKSITYLTPIVPLQHPYVHSMNYS